MSYSDFDAWQKERDTAPTKWWLPHFVWRSHLIALGLIMRWRNLRGMTWHLRLHRFIRPPQQSYSLGNFVSEEDLVTGLPQHVIDQIMGRR